MIAQNSKGNFSSQMLKTNLVPTFPSTARLIFSCITQTHLPVACREEEELSSNVLFGTRNIIHIYHGKMGLGQVEQQFMS